MPSRATLARLAVVVAAGVAFAAPGRASDAPAAGPRDPESSAAGALPTAEVVVVGRTRVLVPPRGAGGTTVVRVEVVRTLRGRTEAQFTLFVGGSRNTADPARPSAAYFEGGGGLHVLFLQPSPAASGFALVGMFRADDLEGEEKTDVLARELALDAEADPAARARKAVGLALTLLGGERPWSRLHGARELERLAARSPAAFDPEAKAEMAAQLRRASDATVRGRLSRALRRLEGTAVADERAADPAAEGRPPSPAPPPAPRGDLPPEYYAAQRRLREAKDDDGRLAALVEMARVGRAKAAPDLLALARGDAPTAVRERAVVLLGESGARGVVTDLYDLDRVEREPAVRSAIVFAVGLLGDDADVPWLEDRAKQGARTEAAYALARVRTEEALRALRELGRAARDAVPPDEALARLVEYLRTPAFAEAERVAGRTVGPRGPPPRPDGSAAGTDGRCPPEPAGGSPEAPGRR